MTKRNRGQIHSNLKTEWETPLYLFESLDKEFNFGLDAAATDENALCDRWFTKEDDALQQEWICDGRSVWLNPPYGPGLYTWVEYAMSQSLKHKQTKAYVCLLPSNTDSKWFHDFVVTSAQIRFIRGRVQFLLNGKRPTSGNPGANLLAIFYPCYLPRVSSYPLPLVTTTPRRRTAT